MWKHIINFKLDKNNIFVDANCAFSLCVCVREREREREREEEVERVCGIRGWSLSVKKACRKAIRPFRKPFHEHFKKGGRKKRACEREVIERERDRNRESKVEKERLI